MPVDERIMSELIVGAVFWVVLLGGAVVVGSLAYLLFGSSGREAGKAAGRGRPEDIPPVSEPAEEGGRLDEWREERLDRAA